MARLASRYPVSGSVTADGVTTSGDYELAVGVSPAGQLTVQQSAATEPATPSLEVPAGDPACSEGAYNLEGDFWVEPVRWFYNESSVSRSGLSVSATLADVRGGNFNMTQGINNCGFAQSVWGVSGAFQGNTSLFANIDSAGHLHE